MVLIRGIDELHKGCTTRIKDCEDHIEQLLADRNARDEELMRYKSFDCESQQFL
jgi:hypothetical protein